MTGPSSEVTSPISQTAQAESHTGSTAADTSLGSSTLPSYTVIDQETALGGAIYPFLEATGRAWRIVESSVKQPASYPNSHTFGMDRPTLRYVNGGKIEDIFVDGLTTEAFLEKTGLELNMNKGGFVLSKRLSRLMRPYFASGSFPEDEVTVKYMDDLSADQVKVWDGAGLISRAMLEHLVIPAGASPAKRAELLEELKDCKRVEFTLMSGLGQDKGHPAPVSGRERLREVARRRRDTVRPCR